MRTAKTVHCGALLLLGTTMSTWSSFHSSQLWPPKKRPACAEMLTRINYDPVNGHFVMDFEDGEIRFRTSIGMLEPPIATKHVEPLFLATMDRYIEPIMRVLYTSEPPDEALCH